MINFGIKDIIDIVLVAILMYQLYLLVQRAGTSSAVFKGVLSFIVIWILVSYVFEMRLLGSIFNQIAQVGLLILIIVFQDEIRRFLMSIGSHKAFSFLFPKKKKNLLTDAIITPIVIACSNMARARTGALIVIEQEIPLSNIVKTGEEIDAEISTRLIENLFFKNSPLHDGAMIIIGDRIKAAGCILPVTQSSDLPKFLGLRHRAAVAISQETDAKVIVVSEERGKISFVSAGEIEINITPEQLQELLIDSLNKGKKKK